MLGNSTILDKGMTAGLYVEMPIALDNDRPSFRPNRLLLLNKPGLADRILFVLLLNPDVQRMTRWELKSCHVLMITQNGFELHD